MPAHTIATVTSFAVARALLPEWLRLFYAARTPNPFAHPLWLLTWARHFIAPSQLFLVTLRTPSGALAGVAPFYQRRQRLAPGLTLRRLQLLGAGRVAHLTELPQVLLAPGHARAGMRDLVRFLAAHDGAWDCAEITLAPEQGWFEREWLPPFGPGAGSTLVHRATRPCVVVPLPATIEAWQSGLKRNVKEGIRRSANRLARAGHRWTMTAPGDGEALKPTLDELVALHTARAAMQGSVPHPDYLGDPSALSFLYDVASDLHAAGHLTPCVLRVDGQAVAARLLLHANGSTFFSISGMDPAWRAYSVGTLLQAECLRFALTRGEHQANLSIGPDESKLRWGEQLQLYQDIMLVGPRRRSHLALALLGLGRRAAHLGRTFRSPEPRRNP